MLLQLFRRNDETDIDTDVEEETPEKEIKSGLLAVIPGYEAQNKRIDAKKEFVNCLEQYDRKHLVSDSAMDKWYGPRILVNRKAKIVQEFGDPESIWLQRD